MKNKTHWIDKMILNNKRSSGGINIHEFKLYCRMTKRCFYWHKNRQVDQLNITEDPKTYPHIYGLLIFVKKAKTIQWKRKSSFYEWCCCKCMSSCRRMLIDLYLSPCKILKFKWSKVLITNLNKLNLTEQKVWNSSEHEGRGDHTLNKIPMALILTTSTNKWNLVNMKNLWKSNDTIFRMFIKFKKKQKSSCGSRGMV